MGARSEKRVGPYHLIDRIAEGGMAEVWKGCARGPAGFEKVVVVKKMLPSMMAKPGMAELFIREAKIAALLSHPNLVQVFDFGEHEGRYYIVMEYVHGKDLGDVMASRAGRDVSLLSLPLRFWIVAEACRGLDHVHRKRGEDGKPLNIVHRDISPQNILLSFDGAVKLADFGVSRGEGEELGGEEAPAVLRGKYPYMSPEQVRGEPLDRRSDVFSLGVVLWELVTGKRLFRARSPQETLQRVREAKVPKVDDAALGLPAGLDALFRRCLAKERGDRFGSAREFGAAIGELLVKTQTPVAEDVLRQAMISIFPEDHRENPNKFWVDLLVRAEGDAVARDLGFEDTTADSLPPRGGKEVTAVLKKESGRAALMCPAALWVVATGPERMPQLQQVVEESGGRLVEIPGASGALFLPTSTGDMGLTRATQAALQFHSLAVETLPRPTCCSLVLSGLAEQSGEDDEWRPTVKTVAAAKAILERSPHAGVVVTDRDADLLRVRFELGASSAVGDETLVPVTGLRFNEEGALDAERRRQPLMGRRNELRRLKEIMRRAPTQSRSRAALVLGETGVGKTRLLAELRTLALQKGHQVVVARADRATRTGCYGLLSDLFHQLLGIEVGDGPKERRIKAARLRVLGLSPRLWRVVGELVGASLDADGSQDLDNPVRPRGIDLLVAARKALEALSRDRPTLLVLEDIDRADQATGSLLPHLLRSLSRAPIAIAMSSLPGISIERALVQALQLAPLTPEDGARLCAHLLDLEHWDEGFISYVQEWSGGRPAWIVRLADALRESSPKAAAATPDFGSDPPRHRTLHRLALLRLARLTEVERALVYVAVVHRGEVDPGFLAEVAGFEVNQIRVAFRRLFALGWFEAATGVVVPAGLLEPMLAGEGSWGGGHESFRLPERVSFPIGLLRREVLSTLGPSARERIHGSVTAVLERAGSGLKNPESAERLGALAYHAARGSDRRRAVDYLLAAADAAVREGDPAAGARFTAEAAHLTKEREGDLGRASTLYLDAAEQALAADELELAYDALGAASLETDLVDSVVALRRTIVEGAITACRQGPGKAIEKVLPVWNELRDQVTDPEALASAAAHLGEWFRRAQQPDQAADAFREAAGFAEQGRGDGQSARYRSEAAICFARAGAFPEAEAEVSAALAAGVRGLTGAGRHRSVAALAELQWARGQLVSCTHRFREASVLAEEAREFSAAASYALIGASIALVEGDGAAAVDLAEKGVSLLPRRGGGSVKLLGQAVKSAIAYDVDPNAAYVERIKKLTGDLRDRGEWLLAFLAELCGEVVVQAPSSVGPPTVDFAHVSGHVGVDVLRRRARQRVEGGTSR